MSNRKQQQKKEELHIPLNLQNTGCKVMTLEEAAKKKLTPLVTYGDKAVVPDWKRIGTGYPGYKAELQALRVMAYALLTGQQPTQQQPSPKQEAANNQELFDLNKYTVR